MALLAIDTSSSICVLGIRSGGDTWVDESDLGRTHSQEILPRIEALLAKSGIKKSELSALVYGQGPGSFTGLRIGVGVVQGLAYGLGIPVVGISSLACLAQQVLTGQGTGALVALAARNTEVYFGAYEQLNEGVSLVGHEGVFEAGQLPAQDSAITWTAVGGGWIYEELLLHASQVSVDRILLETELKANDLLDLGELALAAGRAKPASEALPEYLREQVAAKPANK